MQAVQIQQILLTEIFDLIAKRYSADGILSQPLMKGSGWGQSSN